MAQTNGHEPHDSPEPHIDLDSRSSLAEPDRPISEISDQARQPLLTDEPSTTSPRSHSPHRDSRTSSVAGISILSTQDTRSQSRLHNGPHAGTDSTLTNNDPQSPLLDQSPPRYTDRDSRGPFSRQRNAQNTWQTRLSKASLLELKESVTYSFSPARHNSSDLGTARKFMYWRQGRRLWRLTIGECLLTFIFCAVYGIILRHYQLLNDLGKHDQHAFNTLVTGISLFIGVNLAASLRSYAKLLRWRLLSYCYRPLQNFDLVLGCDSLMNVVQLVWKARNSRHKYLPSWTQVFGVLWLAVNLGMTVCVGMISLNYGLNVDADSTTISTFGQAQLVNLSSVYSGDYYPALSTIQGYGVSGWNNLDVVYDELGWANAVPDTYESLENGTSEYFFQLYVPNTNIGILSPYYVRADSVCTAYNVTEGIYGNLTWFVYLDDDKKPVNQTYKSPPINPGGLLVMSNTNSTCGPTCTNTNAFLSAFLPGSGINGSDFTIAMYYMCNTTILPVMEDKSPQLDIPAPSELQLSDQLSQMLAGSMGWSDTPVPGDKWMYQSYPQTSQIGFVGYEGVVTAANMQSTLSSFAMGGIVAMSASGEQSLYSMNVEIEGAPVPAQYLQVTWKYVLAMLVGISAGHLVSLLIVILLANNAIIKDHSYIAFAKLYLNLLRAKGFDKRGCMLEGDELITAMGNPMVAYGWRETGHVDSEGQPIGHLDVFDQKGEHQMAKGFRRMIYYDGEPDEDQPLLPTEQKTAGGTRRMNFDAKDWF